MLVIALAAGIAFCAVYFGDNYAETPINRTPLFTGFGWTSCMAILGGAAKYANRQGAFAAWMSKNNFGLYVFHYLGISTVALLFAKLASLPAALVYILSLVAGFAFGYLLNAIISRIPFFRWAVLGIVTIQNPATASVPNSPIGSD